MESEAALGRVWRLGVVVSDWRVDRHLPFTSSIYYTLLTLTGILSSIKLKDDPNIQKNPIIRGFKGCSSILENSRLD